MVSRGNVDVVCPGHSEPVIACDVDAVVGFVVTHTVMLISDHHKEFSRTIVEILVLSSVRNIHDLLQDLIDLRDPK